MAKVSWQSAWKVFSEYIRERDGWRCVLCGKSRDDGFIMQAGHVIDVGNNGNMIRFLEDDVFCQCRACNQAHVDKKSNYNNWFDLKFGSDLRERIKNIKKQSRYLTLNLKDAVLLRPTDFEGVKNYYNHKLESIRNIKDMDLS